MSLQFFLGKGEKNHELALLKKAKDWLLKDSKHRVFYIVPNSVKFELEISLLTEFGKLLNQTEVIAHSKLQIFSFSRLAWYYLKHISYQTDERLSEVGSLMVMRKSLRDVEQKLSLYKGEVGKSGFVEQLLSLYEEFMTSGLEQELLMNVINNFSENEEGARRKLLELQFIFAKYEQNLLRYEKQKESILENLATFLAREDLSEVLFLLSGYSYFSATELKLVEQLLIKAAQINIALITGSINSQELNTNDLFYDSKLLYRQCINLAKAHQVPIHFDHFVKEEHEILPDFKQLATYWEDTVNFSKDASKINATLDNVAMIKATSPMMEVKWVATEVRRLISENHARYKDIVILTRELNAYSRLLEPIFKINEIPFASGKDRKMKNHPLVEFFQSLFAVKQYYFRYEDVFRLLRTELLIPKQTVEIEDEQNRLEKWQENVHQFRDAVDLTENVVLRYGYGHKDWTQDADWSFVTYDYKNEGNAAGDDDQIIEAASNQVRRFLKKTLCPFFQQLDDCSGCKKCKEAAQFFYDFLLQAQVDQQLLFHRDLALAKGDLERAGQFEQVWSAFINLLDEYVEIFGEEIFDLTEFIELLSTGLEELDFGMVPAVLDQVEVTTLELARPAQAKYVFVLGAHEKNLPRVLENNSLLSQEERILLKEHLPLLTASGLKDVARVNANEVYIAYRLFLSAKVKLYFSYPENLDDEVGMRLSPYLVHLSQDLKVPIQSFGPPSINEKCGQKILSYLSTYRALLTDLVVILQQQRDQKQVPARFWHHLQTLLLKSAWGKVSQSVFASLTQKNIPENLSRNLSENLYGKHLQASVSRFETFYQCEYRYFLESGLQLKEREMLALTPALAGSFYHEVLDRFFKTLAREKLLISNLSNIQLKKCTKEVLADVLEKKTFAIFQRSKRMKFTSCELSQTLKRVLWAMHQQSKRMKMHPAASELIFGQLEGRLGMAGLDFSLSNNAKLSLRGKIDRLDSDGENLAVVDYKSSQKSFDLASVYYGKAMQMVTYLDVALQNSKKLFGKVLQPAGSFYLHVHHPRIKYEGQREQEFANLLLQEFRLKGFLNQKEGLCQLDKTLDLAAKSLVYPIKLKKDGKPDKSTLANAYTHDEFEIIRQTNRKNFINAGEKVLNGKLVLNPLMESQQKKACQYCSFRSICKFDATLAENNYKQMEKFGHNKKEAILQEMKRKLGNI
ncbi:MAG: PD-(D/E)XK nuclease family protein [Streptococcaceae bacterium]|jgi:ATP-dependent helicase/nuclease subunit B|nr:PD-(D/E)XK nuclease family protein [Streptococcaceae bacterium]